MTHIIKTYIATTTIVLGAALMAACSSGSEESGENSNPIPNTTAPLSIRLAVPETDDTTSTKSRIGDPGADGDETAEWDRLTVIVAFTEKKSGEGIADNEPQKMVYWDTFTRAEFDNATDVVMHTLSKLSPPNSSGYHDVTMYLPQGKCKLYAVTYSKGAGLDIEKMLNSISQDGNDHNDDVQNLNIAGNYGSGNAKQMQMVIGVGTGYAVKVNQETGTAVSPEERTMEVKIDDVSGEKQYWRLIVQRLAAKIDLQWDSQYAYELNGGQYDYIGVTGYEYYTGKTHPLFPTLTTQTFTLSTTDLETNLLKMDDTEISQHNGRTEFYVFPDGLNPDDTADLNSTYVKYTVKSKKTAESDLRTLYYSFKLPLRVQPGTWYKINTDIRGNSETSVDGTSIVKVLSKTN